MTIEQQILSELKACRADIAQLNERLDSQSQETCKSDIAVKILGLRNYRQLKPFADNGLLTRIGTTKFKYYKSELYVLAEKIKTGLVV